MLVGLALLLHDCRAESHGRRQNAMDVSLGKISSSRWETSATSGPRSSAAIHSYRRSLLHQPSPPSQPAPPQYLPDAGPVSNFPYSSCDNNLYHSPLRLGPPNNGSAVAWGSDGLTYCWSVSHVTGTQCDPPLGGGQACCQQDLSAIYFEIGWYANGDLWSWDTVHLLPKYDHA